MNRDPTFLDRSHKCLFLLVFSGRGYNIPRDLVGKQGQQPKTLATLEKLIRLGSFSFRYRLGPKSPTVSRGNHRIS